MSQRVAGFAVVCVWACLVVAVGACGDDTSGAGGTGGTGGGEADGSAAAGGEAGGGSGSGGGSGGSGSIGRPDGGGSGGTGGDAGGSGGAGGDAGGSGGASGQGGSSGSGGDGAGSGGSGGTGGTGAKSCKKDSDCSDGKFCNGAETCDPDAPDADAEGCVEGDAPDCRDTAKCTVDACDEANDKCVHTKTDSRCNDGDFCDGVEICDPANGSADVEGCVADTVDPCDDSLYCTADGCNEGTDACIHVPVNSRCADTNDMGSPDYCNIETCEPNNVAKDGNGCVSVARDCSDSVDCTDDSCNEASDTCDHDPDDDFCDDGLCDGRDTCHATLGCQEAALVGGIPVECNDGFDCTVDGCSADACTHEPDHGSCSDGDFCDGVEACLPNVAGHNAEGCVDGDVPDCSDAYDCTVDSCDPALNGGIGACKNVPDDNACRNTQLCDGQEVCVPGGLGSDPNTGCQDGPLCPVCADPTETPPDCTVTLAVPCDCIDGAPCTADTCDESANAGLGGCDNIPNDNFCNVADGFAMCNGDETCVPQLGIADENGCIAGVPFVCNDDFSCTQDACNATLDECVYTTVDARCNDLDFCNGTNVDGAERCDPDSVSPVPNPTTGCVSDPVTSCATSACSATFCDVPCSGVNCDDEVSCTTEVCNEASNSCVQEFQHAACPMGEVCTDTGCEPGQACMGDGDCDNSNRCQPETCTGGICVPAPRDCDDGIVCTDDFCTTDTMDPRADGNGCVNEPNDDVCNDGNRCNGEETCDATLDCGVNPPDLVCNDGVACTDDSCDPDTGCLFAPNDGNCADAFCNDTFCHLTQGCQPLPPRDCTDAFPCTSDSCDEANDECDHVPNDAACADAFYCNGAEVCNPSLGCQDGAPPNCNDGIACSADSCDEAADACQYVYDSSNCPPMQICTAAGCQTGAACTPPAVACDDGLFCNGAETCSSTTDGVPGVCQAGSLPNCDDLNACTVDGCSDLLGTCTHTPRDQDNDGFGDSACDGTDCNDNDAAVNPLAVDICDGIDNDCIGGIDNGLQQNGGACMLSSQCCSNSCINGLCNLPFPDCHAILDTCIADFECCTGICDTYVDGLQHCLQRGACGISGDACDTASDCCSLGCVGGVCSANPADTCKPEGTAGCAADIECCSNNCVSGTCQAPATTGCSVYGETCSSNGSCCSGLCYPMDGADRCAPHDSCRGQKEICTDDTDCCTGVRLPGAPAGSERGCDVATGQCVALGSCSNSGEACTGTRNCCSALCVDAGWGIGICEFLAGCRPYGEVCTADTQCCSGVENDNDLNGDARCSDPDPGADNLRRCLNVPGCVDPGEICAQGGSNNCCILKSPGCTQTGLGVARCNSSATCIDIGGECQFSEQCCNGKPCIPDVNGVFRCTSSCIGEGGLCGAHADCCPGQMCYESVCVPNNLGCTPVGQPCPPAPDTCCSDFCFGGICGQAP